MKYRTKPRFIEAIQYNSRDDFDSILQFTGWSNLDLQETLFGSPIIRIETQEGYIGCYASNWIIKSSKGSIRVCNDDIFRATYELDTGD